MGSQAGFMVLESEDHARARQARILAVLRDVRVDAGPEEGRAERFAALAPASGGLSVAPMRAMAVPGAEMLADAIGSGFEASFPVGVALAALRVEAGAPHIVVHGFGHGYGEFSALVEPCP
jgi:3-oxoacyl-[acyl-carrier-protein] synthase II